MPKENQPPYLTGANTTRRANQDVERAKLVDRFNSTLGIGGGELARLQDEFISGAMPEDEAAAFSNYCNYMILLATKKWDV